MSKDLPLTHLIYEIVKEKGQIDDQELYEMISSKVRGISLSEVEKALLKLEVMGKIAVSSSGKKGGLLIEIATERRYVAPDEE